MGVRSLNTLRTSIDTMGEEKTMDFITSLIVEHIKEIGEDRVFGVSMDGSCKGGFVLIPERVALGAVIRVSDTWDGTVMSYGGVTWDSCTISFCN